MQVGDGLCGQACVDLCDGDGVAVDDIPDRRTQFVGFTDEAAVEVVVVHGGAGWGDFAGALALVVVGVGGDECAAFVDLEQTPAVVVLEGAVAAVVTGMVTGKVMRDGTAIQRV